MKNDKLCKFVAKADKIAKNNGDCTSCFCYLIVSYLEDFNLDKPFLDWKEKNNIDTACGSVLLYLEDLGVIKILSGVNEYGNVSCQDLDYKIIKNKIGNKI